MNQISICIPVRDFVTTQFSYSLANLTAHCASKSIPFQLNMLMGSEVAMQRQQLAEEALESGCTHILWLDSDMQFPVDILDIMLAHDKDIIALNYSTRVEPHKPVAFTNEDNLNDRLVSTTGINNVVAVGMGCMLVKRKVFDTMDLPYFSVEWNEDYSNLMGEDLYFCNKARYFGFEVHVDNELSNKIAHVGSKSFYLKDTNNE